MLRSNPFPAGFFSQNRKDLAGEFTEESLLLFQSADEMVRNADILHPWRQDSSFFYYTGIDQPNCSLLIVPQDDGASFDEYLFIPPVDPEKVKWTGKMLTPEEATEISGIQKVLPTTAFQSTFYRTQKWRTDLFCELNDQIPDQPLTWLHRFLWDISKRLPGLKINKLGAYIAKRRYLKKPEEIEAISYSIEIINNALTRVLRRLKPGLMEYQIEAELIYQYLDSGCNRVGFEAIVAGGVNATMLHYVSNHAPLNSGELLLIDTGAEYGMYSGDITRTYPINGVFSDRQRQCYQAVLDVNKRFIAESKTGMSWTELNRLANEITGDIYAENGFINDPKKHANVSYHRIGHYLGLDVHDVGHSDWPMEPGAVITVEPGLYLPEEGIGIRIEDNVLFTEKGPKVLSESIPKEINEIEEIIASVD